MLLRFCLKTAAFVVPLLLLFTFNWIYTCADCGDLIRIGQLYTSNSVIPPVPLSSTTGTSFDYVHDNLLPSGFTKRYDVLVIGDSFSHQGKNGFTQFLGETGLSVTYVDSVITGHEPVQTLHRLLAGDFFSTYSVDYVVLETVGRSFLHRFSQPAPGLALTIDSLRMMDYEEVPNIKREETVLPPFFSYNTLEMPVRNYLYTNQDAPLNAKVYRTRLKSNIRLFNEEDYLLFFDEDLQKFDVGDMAKTFEKVKQTLHLLSTKLAKHDVTLVLLICPDKYDLYHPYLANPTDYPLPFLNDSLQAIDKDFLFVSLIQPLQEAMINTTNLYAYGDTHWLPPAAKIAAREIYNTIIDHRTKVPEE